MALAVTLIDLGYSPLADSCLPLDKAGAPEARYPLRARICTSCWLCQVDDTAPVGDRLGGHHAYASSVSESWLHHSKRYAEKMRRILSLGPDGLVIEIGSNDGYLLQYFAQAGVPVLGVEPAADMAAAAEQRGVATRVEPFGEASAQRLVAEGKRPDLVCSANVLAYVADINDFMRGIAALLQGDAVYTAEFPHLLRLISDGQFDTICHAHRSYLSLLAVETIFAKAGLRVFEVEELPTHGGSLRVYACLTAADHPEGSGIVKVRADEKSAHLDRPEGYAGLAERSEAVRAGLMDFLTQAQDAGRTVAAYGAATRGNTLLNYCGVGPDLISFCADRNPAKQHSLLPGSHIPVTDPDTLRRHRPDYVVILPWNLKTEIMGQLADLRALGTQFVTAIPSISIMA